MCGGGAPKTATVDPAAERQKAADDAAKKANASLVNDRRRQRGQSGLLSTEQGKGTLLQRVNKPTGFAGIKNALQSLAE